MIELKIKCFENIYKKEDILPEYKTEGSAGMDLKASIKKFLILKPKQRYLIPTGIAIALPKNTVGLVYARSGLSSKYGISLSNGVGVIDEDYRGEIFCSLINLSENNYNLKPLERIAQIVITSILKVKTNIVNELEDTFRGSKGFGSTGKC